MSSQYYLTPGIGNVGSYIISGTPYLTGGFLYPHNPNNGEVCITFPNVCRSFTVVNTVGVPLMVHFDTRANSNVIGNYHYALLSNMGDSWEYAVRATSVYISLSGSVGTGSFLLSAELTCIDKKELTVLSGAGINN